jgi:hypothetical protein
VACRDCGAEFEVEFDPPDAPALKGRIEMIREPTLTADPSSQPPGPEQ